MKITYYGNFDERLLEPIPPYLVTRAKAQMACATAIVWLESEPRTWLDLVLQRSEYVSWSIIHMYFALPNWFVEWYNQVCLCSVCLDALRQRVQDIVVP